MQVSEQEPEYCDRCPEKGVYGVFFDVSHFALESQVRLSPFVIYTYIEVAG